MSTKEELEAENARLRALNGALISLLGVIASADAPLPADAGKMHLYEKEAARRLASITVWTEPGTDMPCGLTPDIIDGRIGALRGILDRPLRYVPEPDPAGSQS